MKRNLKQSREYIQQEGLDLCNWCHHLLNPDSPDTIKQQAPGDDLIYYYHDDCYQEYLRTMRDRV